jgi:hypothetical protein
MRYQEYFTTTTDAELYRLELIENLGHVLPLLKKQAEQVLGQKIRLATPIGPITDPVHFDEGSEVGVAFYLSGAKNVAVDIEKSEILSSHFANLPIVDIGVIKAIVLQRT